MMKAAEATDHSLRLAPAKLAYHLPCHAKDLSSSNKKIERSGEVCTASRLPNLQAASGPPAAGPPPLPPHNEGDLRRSQVFANLVGIKSRCSPLAAAAVGSMERRRRCCCHANYGSCNCTVENYGWKVEGLSAPLKALHEPERSLSDQKNTISASTKASSEHHELRKGLAKPIFARNTSDLRSFDALDVSARSITNSDARTLSMCERGRWGNSKMQHRLVGHGAAPAAALGSRQHVKVNLNSDFPHRHHHHHHHHHQQPLQHVQCLHCGSFSTTPVSGVAQGARSDTGIAQGARGRKVRDYTWQQELLQEQKRPEQQGSCEEVITADRIPAAYVEQASAAAVHEHMQGGKLVMSWQERYLLLCQAIAAGAFVDGCAGDDMSGPILPASRGYSSAVCDCAACELSTCATAGGAGFRPAGYCNTSSGERMMELEAFSGPLGYVSESKAGAELGSMLEAKRARRRWWARALPSFGRSKSSSSTDPAGGRVASVQTTAHCSLCGQRVWAAGDDERLCSDCVVRAGDNKCESGPMPGPTTTPPTLPRATRSRPAPTFSSHHKSHLPRRWRLMKLCRYLMGFPLQR